jgi:hypothetical protein
MNTIQKTKEQQRYLLAKPAWDKAMQRWRRLYYCHKHDIIFDSEDSSHVEPQEMMKYIYR